MTDAKNRPEPTPIAPVPVPVPAGDPTPDDPDARMRRLLATVGATVGDYRANLVGRGMPEPLADRLAVDLNGRLMDGAFAKTKPSPEEASVVLASFANLFRGKPKGQGANDQ